MSRCDKMLQRLRPQRLVNEKPGRCTRSFVFLCPFFQEAITSTDHVFVQDLRCVLSCEVSLQVGTTVHRSTTSLVTTDITATKSIDVPL